MLGSAMAPIALAFAILDTLHGSPTDIGIVLAARQIAVILLLLFGGVWGDRLQRNRVMVSSNVVSGLSQAVAGGAAYGWGKLWELAVLAVVNGASSAFFVPASSGVIPQTVPENDASAGERGVAARFERVYRRGSCDRRDYRGADESRDRHPDRRVFLCGRCRSTCGDAPSGRFADRRKFCAA